jgi:hypothetical protein
VDNAGQKDATSREALHHQAERITWFLQPETAPAGSADGLEPAGSGLPGGARVLDALWNRLGIGGAVRRLLAARGLDDSPERMLFALVASRALATSRTPAAAHRASEDAFIASLPAANGACRRAADWLPEIKDAVEREVAARAVGLPAREAEPLFLSLTPACSEADQSGDYPPPAVIGMAVTRDGIPVRAWRWPGNNVGPALMRQVKDNLRDWAPAPIVWVADRRLASVESRRRLREGGQHYIIAEKLCPGSAEAAAALSRQGRYQQVTANVRARGVRISGTERLVICHNSWAADRDRHMRGQLLAQLEELIEHADALSRTERAELRGVIAASPGLARYLRVTPGGRLRIGAKAVRAEENLDGKYLLRASDPQMTPADIALGYSRLLEADSGWRTMNQAAGPWAAGYRTEHRIRAHVLVCWLALLLIRVAENACHAPWPELRRELDRIQAGTVAEPARPSAEDHLIPRQGQAVLVHDPSGAAPFAACARLFSRYPLAVTPRSADSQSRFMVLMNGPAGQAGFFVLTKARDDLFTIRSWNRDHGVYEEIRPGDPVPDSVGRAITDGMPLPRDGALLGWVTDGRVTAMLAVRSERPATWDVTTPVPEIRVMPMAGTSALLHWPPFTASPLSDGRLWDYADLGQIVDIGPLLAANPGHAFWVPYPDERDTRRGRGSVVVNDNLPAGEYWLPAGVYVDHWRLREGIQPPPVGQLLMLPGTVDMARKLC